MTVWKVSLAALAMSLGASAQGSKQSDPTDSSAPVPPTKYESAFFGYQPYREEKIQSWRDVNDTVRRAGAEARHESTGASAARQPAPASQGQPPSTPALPAPPGHSGHGTHGK